MRQYLVAALVLLSLCFNNTTHAQIAVTPETGGTGICTNKAMHRTVSYGIPTTPDSIMIRETHVGDFAMGYDTFTLKLPTGWQFYLTTLAFGVSATNDFDSIALSAGFDSAVVYMKITHPTVLDTIYIGNLSIVATSDSAPDGNMYAESQLGVSGLTLGPSGTNFGSFSLSPKHIVGASYVCLGANETYTNTSPGGTWSSSNPTVMTINTSTGVATAIGVGTDTLTYAIDTCTITKVIRVPLCEGINNVTNNNGNIELFPNPADDYLTLRMGNTSYSSCVITNTLGQALLQRSIDGKQTTLPINSLPPGIYFVKLFGDNSNATVRFAKR